MNSIAINMADPVSAVTSLPSLCKFAWEVYKLCKDASESFKNVTQEVLSLHAVLREAEESLGQSPLSDSKLAGLTTVVNGCRDVLTDLNTLVHKYKKLDSKTQRVWHRVGWHMEDIAELRLRLVSNVGLFTAFMSTTQLSVERKLDQLLQEFKSGHREGSVLTTQTVESISMDEKQTWRAIRKELEDFGISIEAFESNKNFIMIWFRQALERGEFQDRQENNDSVDGSESFISFNPGSGYIETQVEEQEEPDLVLMRNMHLGPSKQDMQNDEITSPLSIKTPSNKAPITAPNRRGIFKNIAQSFLRYDAALAKACEKGNDEDVQKLLLKGANPNARRRNIPCIHAACSKGYAAVVKTLLLHGADVNARGNYERPCISAALEQNHLEVVKLLVLNGANINLKYYRREYDNCLNVTCDIDLAYSTSYAKFSLYCSPLSESVLERKFEIMDLLIESGAEIDMPATFSPLAQASFNGNTQVMKRLLSQGANPNPSLSDNGELPHIPIIEAAVNCQVEAVHLLINSGANVQLDSGNWRSALWAATFCTSNSYRFRRLSFIPKPADNNADMKSRKYAVMHLLLKNGADPNNKGLISEVVEEKLCEELQILLDWGGIASIPSWQPKSDRDALTISIIEANIDRVKKGGAPRAWS